MDTRREQIRVNARDGVPLAGEIFLPSNARAVVQLNSGTAVKRSYYYAFAEYLASEGFVVCLWDYRGSEGSAPLSLKNSSFRFRDYGFLDMPAILDYLDSRFPGLQKWIVGHSVGGQQVGFMDNLEKVSGLVAVGASVGYLGFMPFGYRMTSHFFFHIFSPLSHLLFGYNAGKRFGIMEDLPSSVVWEWAAWCRTRDFFWDPQFSVNVEGFSRYTFPVKSFWASDDPIANARSVPHYWQRVQSDKGIEIVKLEPSAFGVREIGHLGYFHRRFAKSLWPLFRAAIRAE